MFGILTLSQINTKYQSDFQLMNAPSHHCKNIQQASISSHEYMTHCKDLTENVDYIVFFEGRLFNTDALKQKLNYSQDAEIEISDLVIKAYKQWKDEFVKELEGEFSIIIFIKASKSIKAFRDPIGIMPFYYTITDDAIYFSTELKRLYALSQFTKVDWKYIKLVLSRKLPETYDKTYFELIKRLPAGHQLIWTKGKKVNVQQYFYFQPADLSHLKSFDHYLKAFRAKIEQAIKRQINDVSAIHSHFSGGLDSTGISAVAWKYSQANQVPFHHYFCGLTKEQLNNTYGEVDESALIYAIAEYGKMPPPTLVSYKDTLTIEDLSPKDRQLEFSFLQSYLKETCEHIEKKNGKILLSGFGGDECITYNQPPNYVGNAFWAGKWRSFWKDQKVYDWKKVIWIIISEHRLLNNLFSKIIPTRFKFWKKRSYGKKILKDPILKYTYDKKLYSINEHMLNLLTAPYITHRIEREKEFASYYDIEIRYPYFDVQLISFFLGLPTEYKLLDGRGRKFYREAIKEWIDYTPFVEQSKSKVPTIPIEMLRHKKGIAKKSLNYQKIYDDMPEKLKSLIYYIEEPIDTDYNDRLSLKRFRWYMQIAEVSNFVKKYDQ
jgi:asparagine synthase (glutamine-hydrolysing)